METKISSYLSIAEKVTRELALINKLENIPNYISSQISKGLGDRIHYAYVDRTTGKIYESGVIDRTVKHILPYFLQPKFAEEIKRLDWSIVDQRGVRAILEKVVEQKFDFESSFLIIPRKRGDLITHFSVLWGSRILEQIDKDAVDFISTICNSAELKMIYLLTYQDTRDGENKELRRKALELKELAGIGGDLISLEREDFYASFLLNVMGRALSRTAVLFLSKNENNTEYQVVASRGVHKRFIEKLYLNDRNNLVRLLKKRKIPLAIEDISEKYPQEELEILNMIETSVLFPLLSKNDMIGILSLGERINQQPYSEKVFDSIKILSNQMVLAIENAKLSNLRYAFSRYVSQQLADGILADLEKIKLGGEWRKVAVLFADIRNFTSMAEKMKPDEVVNLLNTYFSGLTNVVFKYEGTLDKYMGDCVMAVFGVPVSHYNDTERAVVAAVEMQKFMNELNKKREEEGLLRVEIGIGINSGYVISGNMGSIERMDYTVIGDVVNIASRLEGNAKRGQILVTKPVYEEVKYLVDGSLLGTIRVKGKERPVEVYEIKDFMASKYISVVEKREPYISGHFLNIAQDAELVGRRLGLTDEELTKLRSASLLIDVGRIGLSESIFNKREKITPEEFEVIKSHVLRGAEYVEKKLKLFKEGIELVKHHHENYDGSGYPDGLKGEEIPLWARIVSVIDSYHAMTSRRPFREPMKEEEVVRILQSQKGKKYDPKIVDIYLEILRERVQVKEFRTV